MSCACNQTVNRIAHGAVALVKVALRVDVASDEIIASRLAECVKCPHRIVGEPDKLAPFSRCKKCWCLVKVKVRLADEKCPDSKW